MLLLLSPLIFYTRPDCLECRKVKSLLDNLGAEYQEKDLLANPPSEEEIYKFASRLPDGILALFAEQGDAAQAADIEELSREHDGLLNVLSNFPEMLRCPLLTDGARIVVGYREGAITALARADAPPTRV